MKILLTTKTQQIIDQLNTNGYEAYAVGGCVRDNLMGREVTDYDITTNARPEEVRKVFSEYSVIETGIKHGTVTVVVDHIPYEITTYRTESAYTDSRHPDKVTFVTNITDDLSRRDFTMNAVAYSPREGIADPFGGVTDIQNMLIRAVGDPYKRFSEDALRILRAMRFSSVIGFSVEPETSKAIFLLAHTVKKVSPERIYTELQKLLCGKNAHTVVEIYSSALAQIIPISSDISKFAYLPNDFAMRLAYLCGTSVTEALSYLRADNSTKQKCDLLINSAPIPTDKTELKFYISHLGRENASFVASYRRALYNEDAIDLVGQILASGECLSIGELAINGNDLINLGFTGENIGKILQNLLFHVLSGTVENDKEKLLQFAK